eukprot:Selendium_serpulae@DN7271_c0_g1_i1.p1
MMESAGLTSSFYGGSPHPGRRGGGRGPQRGSVDFGGSRMRDGSARGRGTPRGAEPHHFPPHGFTPGGRYRDFDAPSKPSDGAAVDAMTNSAPSAAPGASPSGAAGGAGNVRATISYADLQ